MPRKPPRSQEEIEKMKRELELLRIIRIDGDPKLSIENQERIAELERELSGIPSWSSSKGFTFKNEAQSEYGDNPHGLLPIPVDKEALKELEALERMDDMIISDANPQISIERKKRIAELRKKLGGRPFYEMPIIHTFSQTSKGKNSSDAEKIEALGELKTGGLKKRLSAGAGKSPVKKMSKSR